MRIAALQLDIAWEDPATNLARADALASRAAAAGARLAVLPEMFNTGFTMDAERAAAHAKRTRDGLAAIAARHGLWLIGGYAEPGVPGLDGAPDARPRNAASLFAPTGEETLRYHKIHPFSLAGEHEHYDGGTALFTAEVDGLRVTPLICYDLRFPEPFRAAAGRTDLFVVIANWPAARRNAWRTLLRARAIENQVWLLGVNRVGEGDGLSYAGDSALIDPLGETHAEVAHAETVLLGEVDAVTVTDARTRFSFLADRKPEVYAGL
jgi:predicted amidohydrolase